MSGSRDLRQKAAAWITENPRAFALFEEAALEMAAQGRSFGMKALAEHIRWTIRLTWGKDAEGYKLNNNLVAYIGRELVHRHLGLKDYLEFRRCQDEQEGAPVFELQHAHKEAA